MKKEINVCDWCEDITKRTNYIEITMPSCELSWDITFCSQECLKNLFNKKLFGAA